MKHPIDHRTLQSGPDTVIPTVEALEGRRLLANAPIVVSTLHDELDANHRRGDLSLREAIAMAEDAPGADVIDFAPSLTGTIKLSPALGELRHFVGTITINGPGADRLTIDGRGASRVFSLLDNAKVRGLRVTGGAAASGPAIRVGSDSRAVLERLIIDGNAGGGLHVSGFATASECRIENNRGIAGGGIRVGAVLTLIRSTVSGNRAVGSSDESGDGGGLYADGGEVTIVNSTFSGNSATGNGGGMYFRRVASRGKLTNLTVAGNRADADHDGRGAGGGVFAASTFLTVRNSIVADNRAGAPTGNVADDLFDEPRAMTALDNANNLIGTCRGNVFAKGTNGNVVGTDAEPLNPRLGPLQDNGGPTPTCVPFDDSPAVGVGSNAAAEDAELTVDQRGLTRVVDPGGGALATVDIGAVEVQAKVTIDTVPPKVSGVRVASSQWAASFPYKDGYPVPSGSVAQLAPLPWVNADEVKVTFSEGVNVQRNDLRLRGVRKANYESSAFAYDPKTFTATWTLPAPIVAAETLRVEINAAGSGAVEDAAGNRLDGDWVDGRSCFDSGDGAAGGDFQFRINILPGDVDQSGGVLEDDVLLVRKRQFATPGEDGYDPFSDVNGSGSILGDDVLMVRNVQFTSLPTRKLASTVASVVAALTSAVRGRLPFSSIPIGVLLGGGRP